MNIRRTLIVFLSALLIVHGAPMASAAGILTERPHEAVSMEDLRDRLDYDPDLFASLAEETISLTESAANSDAVTEHLAQLRQMYLELSTLLELYSIDSYADIYDETASDAYVEALNLNYTASDLLTQAATAVSESPCANCIDPDDTLMAMFVDPDANYSGEEQALYDEEAQLEDDYYTISDREFTVEYGSKIYTASSAYDDYWYDQISKDDYSHIMFLISQAENEALGDLYLSLIANRRAQAAYYDYSDVAHYYDTEYYTRDYTPRDLSRFYDAVQSEIVPLVSLIYDRLIDIIETQPIENSGFTDEALLQLVSDGVGSISGELLPPMDYMTEYGYYDITYGEDKAEGAFTTMLYSANAPYIQMQPTFSGYDFSTLVHEFGHFCGYYYSPDVFSSNLDLAEVHSQGLELLMLEHYEDIFGSEAEFQELYTIYNMLYSLIDGCMYDELERFAYATDNVTLEQLNQKYYELLIAYGCSTSEYEQGVAYDWVEVPHLFTEPLYYISYGTSAAAAFELWNQSRQDYDAAVDTYLTLMSYGEAAGFYEVLEQVGLGDPLSAEQLHTLATELDERYDLGLLSASTPSSQGGPSDSAPAVPEGAVNAVSQAVDSTATVLPEQLQNASHDIAAAPIGIVIGIVAVLGVGFILIHKRKEGE